MRRVTRESFVGEIGVIFERPGGFNDVNVASSLLPRKRDGEFGAPDGGFDLGGEIHVLQRATAIGLEVGSVAGSQQIADR